MVKKILDWTARIFTGIIFAGLLVAIGAMVYGIGALNILSATGQAFIAPAFILIMYWACDRLEKISKKRND